MSVEKGISRRNMLQVAAVGAAGLSVGACNAVSRPPAGATKGRINQSVVSWCYEKHWSLEKTCQIAKQLGCKSVELIEPKDWPILKKYGLVCAITPSHLFVEGMNNPKYQAMCIEKMRTAIDATSDAGFPNVITFTGFAGEIGPDEGIKNCVNGFKKIIGYAEKKKVNLCIEILNSRVAEDMKGHPGYQGDHADYCMEIIYKIGSPRFKLLFDIYHVQIMDGDIITRIRQYKDHVGHYHVAGNPGRNEIDDTQEINYKPIMEEIVRTGYTGYVGQEFIPTRDPLESLRQAVVLCDV